MATEDIGIRARLIGARQYIADVNAAARAQANMAKSADQAGLAHRQAHRHLFTYNQAIFTARRLLFGLTVATAAAGAAAVVTGFRFDAAFERTQIALEALSRGQFDATEQTKEFLRIARETALLPQQVIEMGQAYIAMGFSAQDATRTIRALGFTIAALNLPQATLDRVVFALGQIQVKGRLMGEEIRQLANAQIPVYRYLNETFGDTVTQMNRIGDARIPAALAIDAIITGLEKDFTEAGKAVVNTTSGQLEVLKGDLQAIMGAFFLAPFELLGDRLQKITAVTGQMFEVALEGGGAMQMIAVLDEATGGTYHLVTAAETLANFLEQLWGNVTMVAEVLSPFVKLAAVTAFILLQVTTVISQLINLGGKPLVIILQLLVTWWLAEIAVKRISWLWDMRKVASTKLQIFWGNRLAFITRLQTIANTALATSTISVWSAEQKRYINVQKMGWLRRLVMWTWAAAGATWAFNAALLANPITWVVIGGIAMAGVLYLLWQRFENLRPVIAAVGLLFYPLGATLFFVYTQWKNIGDIIQWVWDKMKGFADWLSSNVDKFAIDMLPGGAFIKGALKAGGAIAGGGRDLVNFDVNPVDFASRAGGALGITVMPQAVNLDGRQVAEVVYDHRLDRIARR